MGDKLITAVVIDDHEAVRDGIDAWCAQADPPIRVVATQDRVAVAWTDPGAAADVVVLDLQLTFGGLQEFGELRRLAQAGRRIVVYTQDADRRTAVRCIGLGALAYVDKSEGKEHLVAAIRAAAAGQAYTPPSLSGSILSDDDPSRPRLSPMETEALRVWFSCASKELAGRILGISPKTVNGYIERVAGEVRRGRPGRADQEHSRPAGPGGRIDHARRTRLGR